MSAPIRTPADNHEQEIFLRAYTQKLFEEEGAGPGNGRARSRPRPGPSEVSLIFDVETTTDASQRMRFLTYQLRIGEDLDEQGIVIEPAAVTEAEVDTIRAYCAARGLPEPMDLAEFRSEVLIKKAYELGATIVLFNAPFDISRIALDAGKAHANKWRMQMQDGFSFRLSESDAETRIQVKTFNPRAGFLEFTARRKQPTSRSRRKKKDYTPVNRGHIVDVRTLSSALLSGSFSLARLTQALDTPTKKTESDEHGAPITDSYLDYARDDVQATWECYLALKAKYDAYKLAQPLHEIRSEASICKAVLQALKIGSWRQCQPDADPRVIGLIMGTFFGGRAEIHIRKQLCRVLHTDFTSMYPTVIVLQNLRRFLVAKGFTQYDSAEQTRAFLNGATVEDFQNPEAWPNLATLVQVHPSCDLFPVRAAYAGEKHSAIGLNELTTPRPIWVTLADCLVAKFQTGKIPEILAAITFSPGDPQDDLQTIRLFGDQEFNPYEDDLFREVIRLREGIKAQLKTASPTERVRLEELRQAYKITANSGYGIFAQFNVHRETAFVDVHGLGEEPFRKRVSKVEETGPFFHPLLATLITSGARLMLTLAEVKAREAGLDWAFCDTDSLAIAQPERMAGGDFLARAQGVVDWFKPLNPYGFDGSILKIEDLNYCLDGSGRLEPLYCWAISAKRYALFNLAADGTPIIRKASAHGLGHLAAPYGEDDDRSGFPAPIASLKEGKDRVPRWQHDYWYGLICAALAGKPHGPALDYHPSLTLPAVSRYSVTSPLIWGWFDKFNTGKLYADRVKPFGFLYCLHARKAKGRARLAEPGVKVLLPEIHPITLFEKDVSKAVRHAFDRETGEAISIDEMQTYAEALAGYANHPESKFLNGGPFDTGPTERRHVIASDIVFVGKESEGWEEGLFLGIKANEALPLGPRPLHGSRLYADIREAAKVHKQSAVARECGLARSVVAKLCRGEFVESKVRPGQVRSGILRLAKIAAKKQADRERRRGEISRIIEEEGGVRAAARKLGVDASNLSKKQREGLPVRR